MVKFKCVKNVYTPKDFDARAFSDQLDGLESDLLILRERSPNEAETALNNRQSNLKRILTNVIDIITRFPSDKSAQNAKPGHLDIISKALILLDALSKDEILSPSDIQNIINNCIDEVAAFDDSVAQENPQRERRRYLEIRTQLNALLDNQRTQLREIKKNIEDIRTLRVVALQREITDLTPQAESMMELKRAFATALLKLKLPLSASVSLKNLFKAVKDIADGRPHRYDFYTINLMLALKNNFPQVLNAIAGSPDAVFLDELEQLVIAHQENIKLVSSSDYNPQCLQEVEVIKKISPNQLSMKQREMLNTLKTTLESKMRDYPDNDKQQQMMHQLVNALIDNIADLLDNRISYEDFTKKANYTLHHDKHYNELRKSDSVGFYLYYAIVATVRAFFRVFDVLLTLGAKHTMNDTPGRVPFFRLPEASLLSKRFVSLSKEFDDELQKLSVVDGSEPAKKGM